MFREYAQWLHVDLCFQDFDNELRTLPGAYAPPTGCLWLATVAGEAAGCVGLRPLAPHFGEIKRLYTVPRYRGIGIGRALMVSAVGAARSAGFSALRLDTLPNMHGARRLYERLGFRAIEPYYANPISGAVYLELPLDVP